MTNALELERNGRHKTRIVAAALTITALAIVGTGATASVAGAASQATCLSLSLGTFFGSCDGYSRDPNAPGPKEVLPEVSSPYLLDCVNDRVYLPRYVRENFESVAILRPLAYVIHRDGTTSKYWIAVQGRNATVNQNGLYPYDQWFYTPIPTDIYHTPTFYSYASLAFGTPQLRPGDQYAVYWEVREFVKVGQGGPTSGAPVATTGLWTSNSQGGYWCTA